MKQSNRIATFPLTSFEDNLCLTYPHTNGFLDNDELVLHQYNNDLRKLYLCSSFNKCQHQNSRDFGINVNSNPEASCNVKIIKLSVIDTFSHDDNPLFFADCHDNMIASVILGNLLLWVRKGNTFTRRIVFTEPKGFELDRLCSFSPCGKKILFALRSKDKPDSVKAYDFLLDEDRVQLLLEKDGIFANHFQYSQADSGWFAYSHEGDCLKVSDRIHGWHHTHNPEGNCVFNQYINETGSFLSIGHERCSFHDTSLFVVGYGCSVCGPRGIYEVFFDSRKPRLVSQSERDWHVNVSVDGRYCVCDTTGSHDLPGSGWENNDGKSSIMLINNKTGSRVLLASVEYGPGHPWHPHPCFSPDGKHVLFNEYRNIAGEDRNRVILCCIDKIIS